MNDRVDAPGTESAPGTYAPEELGTREYRVEELAEAAGITVRTLRFYRERRLLPPPRREGRIAWYTESHLARLRTIAALLERGHTLGGITELITAWENGRTLNGVAELLGLGGTLAASWSDETPVVLTPQELADYFGDDVSPENLTTALEIGYISVAGENALHTSRRLLDVSAALVREGIPLAAVLAAGREVRTHVDAIAELFTQVVKTHVFGSLDDLPHDQAQSVSDAMQRLRPLAKDIVDAEMSLAMERRVRIEIDAWLRREAASTAPDGSSPHHRPPAPPAAPQRPSQAAAQARTARAQAPVTCESGEQRPVWEVSPVQQPHDANAEQAILSRISQMVADEKALRDLLVDSEADGADERARLTALEHELDQCWDLLRQRRALSEAGEDPGSARVRPSSTVEGYQS